MSPQGRYLVKRSFGANRLSPSAELDISQWGHLWNQIMLQTLIKLLNRESMELQTLSLRLFTHLHKGH